ncbi:hypothetical protein SELMODRAFT_233249 [Selaginella moellendorffii]|uniref:BPL/LPL catalytic domain-containing protein n=1 Tax=Selaginella moellendorffii TaxID=88036 RepID=D8S6F6_SELML|nr:hypothetical protein SELMODRAFT_233249 [Selaginella moellendorffii]
MRFVKLSSFPILEQLRLEANVFRKSHENWCIVSSNGTIDPTIVVGRFGEVSKLVDMDASFKDNISVVRRASGGGTVIVDRDTMFVTLVCSSSFVKPLAMTCWASKLYTDVFRDVTGFQMDGFFDHVKDGKKFGGSAERRACNRGFLHTSFLWDYNPANMNYLKFPPRVPAYRLNRSHGDFLCKMKDFLPYRNFMLEELERSLGNYFVLQPSTLEDLQNIERDPEDCTDIISL